MAEEATFGDFILGMEGLAIMRAWMVDPVTVKFRARKIAEVAARLDEEPWSTPIAGGEQTVTAGYTEWAVTYDNSGNPVVFAEEPVVRETIARYPVGAALDAACGSGRHSAYLDALGHRVIGIDATPGMLDLARAKAPTARFKTGDLSALPVPDGSVDLAVCALALTHCADLGPPVSELARVVRPGGRVVISDVHPVTVMLGAQGSYRRNGTELGFVRNYVHLASDYLSAFRAAGLDVVQCLEPLWGEQEIAAIRFAGEMPDLVEAAAKGLPIVIVWELEKPPLAVS